MSIFGLDEVAPGGMWGAPAPVRRQAQAQVPWYAPQREGAPQPIQYQHLLDDKDPWNRLYNKAYLATWNRQIHLGNMFEVIQPKDFDGAKPEKRTRNLGIDWNTGKMRTEEYWHIPDFDHEMYRSTVHNAVRKATDDRIAYDAADKLDRDTQEQQNKQKTDLEETTRKQAEWQAAMQRRNQDMQEQAKYNAAVQAAHSARAQNMASQSVKKFAHDPAAAYGGGGSSAASQKLLSHKGLENDSKLGGSQKLGRKTLLGGA